MTVRRYIRPYRKNENDIFSEPSVRQTDVPKVVLTCDNLCHNIQKETFVSRGSLLGYKDEIPVYASIEGIVTDITVRRESYAKEVTDITVRRHSHGKILWTEIPFYAGDGSRFLNQLGIKNDGVKTAEVICINSVNGEPYAAADYSLLVTETAKAVLGADALGRCMRAKRIIFYIGRGWRTAGYLLDQYIKKYGGILSRASFEVQTVKRRYPMPVCAAENAAVFDVQTAVWAYQGCYEHEPALDVCIAVTKSFAATEIRKVPVGAVIEDILTGMGDEREMLIGKRFVLGGLIRGRSAAPSEAAGADVRQLCVLDERTAADFDGQLRDCLGCHLCERYCPVRVIPYKLNETTLKKCIGCNLCSYICPVKISLAEHIRRTDIKIKGAKMSAVRRKKEDTAQRKKENIAQQKKEDTVRREKTNIVRRKKEDTAQRKKTDTAKKERMASRYIILPMETDIPAAVPRSDAPPHIHSGYSPVRVYGVWILALLLPAAVRLLAEAAAAQTMLFSTFFFMAFHEIFSGFFPSFFYKSHILKGVADGLTVGLLLPSEVPFAAILAAAFLGVLTEKLLFRYKISINTPALSAAVLLILYADRGSRLYALLPWEAGIMSAAVLVSGLFLWLLGYLYAAPAVLVGLLLNAVFRVPLAETFVISVFFVQRWKQGSAANS